MVALTQRHHDWVKDALNVDPNVYDQPDDDIEATLGQSKFIAAVDISQLIADFSNSVHAAVKRARDTSSDLDAIGAVEWRLDDASGAAAAIAKSAPALNAEQKAILEDDLDEIRHLSGTLKTTYDDTARALDTFAAATAELQKLPQAVSLPPEMSSDNVDDVGGTLEHVWDFLNSVTQIFSIADPVTQVQFAVTSLHLIAGTDFIKDAIKNDTTDDKIKAISKQLEDQRNAVNATLAAVAERTAADIAIAVGDLTHKLEDMQRWKQEVATAIAKYTRHLGSFATPAGGKKGPSEEAKKALTTYQAVLTASAASQAARHAMNTKALGPSGYKRWVQQLVPVGKPVTDDAKTNGACVFAKGNVQTRYGATVPVVEALASGMELVDAVYTDAPKIDALAKQWSSAMQASK